MRSHIIVSFIVLLLLSPVLEAEEVELTYEKAPSMPRMLA